MAEQNPDPSPVGVQGQPSGGVSERPTGQTQNGQPAPQGLMGMAHVQPSGTEYKSYDPVDPRRVEEAARLDQSHQQQEKGDQEGRRRAPDLDSLPR